MTFAYPAVLTLLALPVLLMVWEWRRRGTVVALPFDHANARRGRWLECTVKTANLLAPMLLAVSIILLAGPQRPLSQGTQRVLTNIELVLDVSGSMTAQYGDGRRADKAVEALQEFVNHRKGDAFGVTLFGTEVLHWVPLTKDLDALKNSAPFMKPEAMPPYMGGTRIGLALRSVHKILADRPKGDKMIVLISDGSSGDLRGQSDKISSDLNGDEIVLYYIHVANGQPSRKFTTSPVAPEARHSWQATPRRCRRCSRKSTPCNRRSSSRKPQFRRTTSGHSHWPASPCSPCNCSPCSA